MVFEICAIVATLMLIILTIYIVFTLKEVQKSLRNMNTTVSGLELELSILREDVNKLLSSSTELVQKVNDKISDLDPLFETVHNVGEALNQLTQKRQYIQCEKQEEKDISEKILDILNFGKIGIKLYQRIKKRK